jgi:hypothetical protein
MGDRLGIRSVVGFFGVTRPTKLSNDAAHGKKKFVSRCAPQLGNHAATFLALLLPPPAETEQWRDTWWKKNPAPRAENEQWRGACLKAKTSFRL